MDPNSLTYNVEAQEDDGSCVYAYDIALGFWDIVPDCEEIDILGQQISLNDQLPDSIEVQGSGDGSLFIDFAGTQLSGEIDYSGVITVPNQTTQVDFGLGFPLDIDVQGEPQTPTGWNYSFVNTMYDSWGWSDAGGNSLWQWTFPSLTITFFII